MSRKSCLALAAAALLGSAPPASASAVSCPPGSLTATQIRGDQYNPAARIGPTIAIRIKAAPGLADRSCLDSAPIVLRGHAARGDALLSGRTKLQYSRSNSPLLIPRRGRASALSPAAIEILRSGRAVQVNFATLEPGQLVEVGAYQGRFTLAGGGASLAELNLRSEVAPAVQLARPSRNGIEQIEFEDPKPGDRHRTSLFFRTNAHVLARGRSNNGGVMVHALGPSYGTIPYQVSVNGRFVDPSGKRAVELNFAPRGTTSKAIVDFQITGTSDGYAGDYLDVFTLELVAY